MFRAMKVNEQAELIEKRKFYPKCLSWNHSKEERCRMMDFPCGVQLPGGGICKRDHNKLLREASNVYCDTVALSEVASPYRDDSEVDCTCARICKD